MKTYSEISNLNYNDLSFFTGKPSLECKWIIADLLKIEDVTPKGLPKIKISDEIDKSKIDFKIKSNSHLEGKDQMRYLCDHYNKGTTINNLYNFSENKPFIKKIKFTGKHSILNDIMNPEQLLKLQKTWLLKNLGQYRNNVLTDEAYKFIKQNTWAKDYLKESHVDVERLVSDYEKPVAA